MLETDDDMNALFNLPPELVFKRVKGTGRPIAQIIPEIATAVSEWQSVGELCHLVDPRKKIELNEQSLDRHINWLNQKEAESISQGFVLFDGNYKSGVFLEISLGYYSNLERLKISIGEKCLQSSDISDDLLGITEKIGEYFDAFTGYVFDHRVASFNEKHNIPVWQFDSSEIPYGIWWTNYWSAQQVRTIGLERVLGAGWHKTAQSSNDAIVAVIAPTRPDLTASEELQRFEQVAQYLNLRELQRASHSPKNFSFDSVA